MDPLNLSLAEQRALATQELSECSQSVVLYRKLLSTNPGAFTEPLASTLYKMAVLHRGLVACRRRRRSMRSR